MIEPHVYSIKIIFHMLGNHLRSTLTPPSFWMFDWNECYTYQHLHPTTFSTHQWMAASTHQFCFFGLVRLGIIDGRNMYGCVMHRFGGKLYTHTTIGHTEYGLATLECLYAFTFRGSAENNGFIRLKFFHALASDGWVSTPVWESWYLCHAICSTLVFYAYNFCNLEIKGM